jgi:hypothetical protein
MKFYILQQRSQRVYSLTEESNSEQTSSQWHSSIFSQTYAEAEMKKEKERVILLLTEKRDGVFSRGPALPWKQTVALHQESYLSIRRVAGSLQRRREFAKSRMYYDRYDYDQSMLYLEKCLVCKEMLRF